VAEEEEEAPLYSHCLNPGNAYAYFRLVLLASGWVCLSFGQPLMFFIQYLTQMLLQFLELALFASP